MRLFSGIMVVLLATGLAGTAQAQNDTHLANLTVQGIGKISAVPDTAFISSGVVSQSKTAREALDANTSAMSELIKVLQASGIETKDIQTSNFSVQPQYIYSNKRDESGYNQPPQIVGYQVSNQVNVRVRDLDSLGAVLDRAVSVGANTINNVSFAVDDNDSLLDEARRRAVTSAIAKAQLYAKAANVTLDRILSISESGGSQPYPVAVQMARMESFDSAPVPVQAGELTFSASVSIQWELGQ